MAVRKTISITEEQEAFLTANHMSLSRITQSAINKTMEDLAFAKLTRKNLSEMEEGKYTEMELEEFQKTASKW